MARAPRLHRSANRPPPSKQVRRVRISALLVRGGPRKSMPIHAKRRHQRRQAPGYGPPACRAAPRGPAPSSEVAETRPDLHGRPSDIRRRPGPSERVSCQRALHLNGVKPGATQHVGVCYTAKSEMLRSLRLDGEPGPVNPPVNLKAHVARLESREQYGSRHEGGSWANRSVARLIPKPTGHDPLG